MEVSEYLVGSPAFKAGGTGDPRTAGAIPVHLRQPRPIAAGSIRAPRRPRFALRLPGGLFARTGCAASGYRGRRFEPSGEKLEFEEARQGRVDTFAASGYPGVSQLWSRLGPLLIAVLLFSLLLPGSLGAQSQLLSSSPADGESLSNLDEVTFEFDTLLRSDGAAVSVLRRDGTDFPVTLVEVVETELNATLDGQLPSGNYEVSYSVRGADGAVNEGSIRVSVDSPEQALSGGLLAILGIAFVMVVYLGLVLRNDKNRRPSI